MGKEIFNIDLTEGKRAFDTSKMNKWTPEDWKEWVGEPEDHNGLKILLVDDSNLYLKVTSIYYNEVNENMYVKFDADNKLDRDIHIQFGKWQVE